MKNIWISFLAIGLVAFAMSCDDVENTPQFAESNADFVVTPSTTSVNVTAEDSLSEAISFTWTDPGYTVGLSKTKFRVMVGETGQNFTSFLYKDFADSLTGNFLGKEINSMALKFGGVIGETLTLDVKVIASRDNNNEPKESAVFQVDVVPYGDLTLTTSASSVVLTSATSTNVGVSLSWSTVFSGYDATTKAYELEYAEGGTSFAFPIVASVTSFSKSFTQSELNDIAFTFGVAPEAEGFIDFRIKATVNESGTITVLYSNVTTVSVTTYATSFKSIYGMGAALNGWGPWPDKAVELTSSEFNKFETVAYFINGEIFRFFKQLDWGPTSYNYEYFTTVDPDLGLNSPDNDKNFKVLAASGFYRIAVDLTSKTVVMEAVAEPTMFMMGAALNGWGPWNDKEVKMTYVKPGVFTVTASFNLDIFRFFAQADWGPTSYNYEYFTSVDPIFTLNSPDNEKNFRVSTAGTYTITVDLNAKTVVKN